MLTDTNPAPNGGSGLSRCPPTTTVYVDVRRRLSDVQERPRRPGNLHRGEGIHVYRRVPPRDHPHVYINMGEADTILCPLRDAVPLQSWIDTARCLPADSFFADNNAV